MARNSRSLPSLVLALVATPAVLMAQGTTSGVLTGTVRDTNGAPLAGATIRISSPSLIGGERVVRAGENGSYRFPVLPPGNYKLVVEAQGFTTQTQQGTVNLGGTTTFNFRLANQAAATVEVLGSAINEDPVSVATTRNFKAEDLENLPIKRDLAAIAALTPGINLAPGSGTRVSASGFGGDRDNANAYLINGVNVGDPSTGQQWVQVNPDWFDEVQIGGIGAGAEFGGFSGAYFNGMVKKGGNDFSGSLNTYYQGDSWSAERFVTDGSGNPLKVVANKTLDTAANFGGAIVKDRFWYFLSLGYTSTERLPPGSLAAEKRKTPRFMGNFTWKASPDSTLSLFMDYDSVNSDYRGASRYVQSVATTKQVSPSFTYGLEWLNTINSSLVLTVRASGYTGKDDRKPYNGDAYPLYVDGGVVGYAGFPLWNNLVGLEELNNAYQISNDKRRRTGLLTTLDWFKAGLFSAGDSHAIKIGIDIDRSTTDESVRFPGGISLNAIDDGTQVSSDFVQVGGGYQFSTKVDRTALFVQDTWSVSDHLLLRPGLRFETFKGGDGWKTNTLAPRLGVTVNFDSSKRTAVKMHLGRYYNGLSAAMFDRSIPGAYNEERRHYWGNYDAIVDPANPTVSVPLPDFATDTPYSRINEASRLDPNIKQPYLDEIQVAFEKRVGETWSLSLSGMRRHSGDQIVRKDLAPLQTATSSFTNPLTGQSVVFNRPNSAPDYLITNEDSAYRRYYAVTFSAEGKITKGMDFFFSATQSSSYGNLRQSNGYSSRYEWVGLRYNADGDLPGNNDQEVKARLTWLAPWGIRAGASFTYLSGQHYTRYWRMSSSATPNRASSFRDVYIEPMGASTYDPSRQIDLKVSKAFKFGRATKLELLADVFNVLNDDAVVARGARYNSSLYNTISDIVQPRNYRVGLKVSF